MRRMGLCCNAASILSMLLLVTVWMGSSPKSHVEARRSGSLKYGFYKKSCPNAEKIVFREMQEAYANDRTVAPGIVRLIFHDCFVRVSKPISSLDLHISVLINFCNVLVGRPRSIHHSISWFDTSNAPKGNLITT